MSVEKIRETYWIALKMNWRIWTISQYININYVPLQVSQLHVNHLFTVILPVPSFLLENCLSMVQIQRNVPLQHASQDSDFRSPRLKVHFDMLIGPKLSEIWP